MRQSHLLAIHFCHWQSIFSDAWHVWMTSKRRQISSSLNAMNDLLCACVHTATSETKSSILVWNYEPTTPLLVSSIQLDSTRLTLLCLCLLLFSFSSVLFAIFDGTTFCFVRALLVCCCCSYCCCCRRRRRCTQNRTEVCCCHYSEFGVCANVAKDAIGAHCNFVFSPTIFSVSFCRLCICASIEKRWNMKREKEKIPKQRNKWWENEWMATDATTTNKC